jgi:class 3 adenylate cyclase/predicted ATPase
VRLQALLPAVLALLRQEGRVTYRTIKYVFSIDDALLEEIGEELALRRLAVDEEGKVLVWTGEAQPITPPAVPIPSQPATAETTAVVSSPAAPTLPPVALEAATPSTVSPVASDETATVVADDELVAPEPARSAPEAERRQLTVMFCDLADSTKLSRQLDPEDLREVVRAYQATATEVIHQYEGHMAQYLGDGLLIYFGWPVAHEDDAQRAAHAGLGIVEAITTNLNPRLEQEKGVQLAVRLGIHTGPVVVGEMGGGGRHENLATGETVNIAARLEGLAASNTVMISNVTARLLRDAFVLEDLGPHELKGVADPMQVFRVLGPLEAHEDETVVAGVPFLVGRDEEMGLLLRRWEQSKDGHGQVVLISGAAGIGKSSLTEVLRAHVRDDGMSRIAFRCSSYHKNSALYPVIAHVERLLNFQREDAPETNLDKLEQGLQGYSLPLEEVVPLLAALLSVPLNDRYPKPTLTPQQQKQQTLDALVAWMLEEAERRPVLVAWEDLHWADPSTLEMLGLVLEQTPTVPMLHMLTFRPEFELPWPTRSHMTPITLNRLERSQVEALITHLARGKALPSEVIEHIVAKTDGVPLYVEELTKMLLESDLLREQEDQYTLTGPLLTVAIPDTLQDSLMARLDQLNTAKEVAQLGSVLGREFAYDMLQAISPQDEATLQAGLARLVGAELFYQRGRPPQARYIFKHALIQDAAYASLLRSTRQQIHTKVAGILIERFPELAETQPELPAYHYAQAGLAEPAVDYWQVAAERAIQRSAYVEAIHSLDQALAQLAELPPGTARDQRELSLQMMKLAPLYPVKGYSAPECDETSARALTLCRSVGDDEMLFPALYGRWAVQYVMGRQRDAFALSQEYLERASAADDDAAVIVGNRIHAVALLMRGDVEGARAHARQALERYIPERHMPLIMRFGQDLKVQCLSCLALSEALAGRLDAAVAFADEAIAHARSLQHIPSLAYTLLHAGVWLSAVIRQTETLHCYGAELLDLACEHRLRFWEAMTRPFLEHAEAAEQALNAYRRDCNAHLVVPQYLCHIGETYLASGLTVEAHRVLKEADDLMEEHGEVYWQPEVFRLRGHLAATEVSGDLDSAVAAFQQARLLAHQRGFKLLELRAATSLARLWQQQGKQKEAYDQLAPVYSWFTEGFDTADLQEAKTLLQELA